ncbi:MAG TPA: hypothetical protein VKS82_13965 [Streptosporangiaceae bacterium]|jgi:hypothetical protein|nr:hypothetical protein [Streptosporangiaceae bacterium]
MTGTAKMARKREGGRRRARPLVDDELADRLLGARARFPASHNAAAPSPWHPDRMPLRCLLVDDNDAFLEAARVLLEREGMQVPE